ncbi:MAG: hypothetical protein H0X36_04430 [Sphingomonadaceae bacterium]|nr:hypothetical protein [Sphingomonadaceae bacterium]
MPVNVEMPDDLFARLQRHAVPLVDTSITVITRALDALEAANEEPVDEDEGQGSVRTFNPAAPPNIAHTTVRSARVAGEKLARSECYWNQILFATIVAAAKKGVSTVDIFELAKSNYVAGKKEGGGWYHLDPAGISIQGTSAPYAWRQTYSLASSLGIEVQVNFAWQDTEKAVHPNAAGSFYVEGDR